MGAVLVMAGCGAPVRVVAPTKEVARAVVAAPPQPGWVAVDWSELPGFGDDALVQAWGAWLQGCERATPAMTELCPDVRRLSIAEPGERRSWMQQRLQPYRLSDAVQPAGLLTGYFEPVLRARRQPDALYRYPLYQAPAALARGTPWYSRQHMDTLPEAQAQLEGRVLAYLSDPVDVLSLQMQGSGQLLVESAQGGQRVRLEYAGSNGQPFRSVGRWLLEQGLVRDASWTGVKAWLAQNPARERELLWVNPRVTFFREVALAAQGPVGAQGVALTAMHSVAVDPAHIALGTALWLETGGPTLSLRQLVLAQDTGSAIAGAARADLFVGSGPQAGALAARLRQPLRLWALWPKRTR